MNLKSFLWEYGEKVSGYEVRVVNEREARAAAGILGMLGIIVIFLGIGFNHIIVARVYLAFLWFDFSIRILSPRYAPSLLIGKFVVQNQRPEYVGALQKRFAWTLGWFISLPMVYWFVLHWDITFYKVMVCVLCILLAFLESAFSICVGCKMHKIFSKQDLSHCPGGTCDIRIKEPIQTFNPIQKAITALSIIGFIVSIYLFLAFTESKTFFGEFLHEAVLNKEQLKVEQEKKYEKEAAEAFGDDDDF